MSTTTATVIWGHIAWGKLREYEVYEDTEKSRELDAWLARTGKGGGAGRQADAGRVGG